MRARARLSIVVLAIAGLLAVPFSAQTQSGEHDFADQAFQDVWDRTDLPVELHQVSRTWMWGPGANTPMLTEPYAEGDGGVRQVQYTDKSRMELPVDAVPPDSDWFITQGLLATELMTGALQLGHHSFEQHQPADIYVAGDPVNNQSPTYAQMGQLMDTPPRPAGGVITQGLASDGSVIDMPETAQYGVTDAHYIEQTDNNIASVFWDFMNSTGVVFEDGVFRQGDVFTNPFYAIGFPRTEAYWGNVTVAGEPQLVLMQCFERRCLTYAPGNPEGWEVESGNIGQHYYDWRYEHIDDPADDEPPVIDDDPPVTDDDTGVDDGVTDDDPPVADDDPGVDDGVTDDVTVSISPESASLPYLPEGEDYMFAELTIIVDAAFHAGIATELTENLDPPELDDTFEIPWQQVLNDALDDPADVQLLLDALAEADLNHHTIEVTVQSNDPNASGEVHVVVAQDDGSGSEPEVINLDGFIYSGQSTTHTVRYRTQGEGIDQMGVTIGGEGHIFSQIAEWTAPPADTGANLTFDPQDGGVRTVGETHTFEAILTEADGSTPIAGAMVSTYVDSGPNHDTQMEGVSDADGRVELSYVGDGGPGTDEIWGWASFRTSDGHFDTVSISGMTGLEASIEWVEPAERAIYAASNVPGGIHRFDTSGQEQWFDFRPNSDQVAVNPDGEIFLTGLFDVRKYNANEELQWVFTDFEGRANDIAVDRHGNVRFVTNDVGCDPDCEHRVFSLDGSNGSVLWTYNEFDEPIRAVAVDTDQNAYAGSWDNSIRKLDGSGREVWINDTFSGNVNSIAVHPSNGVIVGSATNVYRLNPNNGDILDEFDNVTTNALIWSLAVDPTGSFYAGTHDGNLYRVAPSGSVEWAYSDHGDGIASIAVDPEGFVYTASRDTTVRKLTSSGDHVWTYDDHDGEFLGIAVEPGLYGVFPEAWE